MAEENFETEKYVFNFRRLIGEMPVDDHLAVGQPIIIIKSLIF